MLNLATLLDMSARRNPGKVAVIFEQMHLRYAEVNGAANKIANGLAAMGVKRGDHVAIMLPNAPHFVICYYAILKLGAAVVPLNVLFKRHEVEYHLKDSDAVALIAWEGFLGEAAEGFAAAETCQHLIVAQTPGSTTTLPSGARPLDALMADTPPTFVTADTNPDDTAVILYTSGTTGRPKGAELSHSNMLMNAVVGAEKVIKTAEDEIG
ncbi:MAG TPA: AMP-binding protein, partial [Roseiflexaceae bacterium]|nr:AMP-binding protein [Roseiflexaceae bacterium]